MRGKMLGCLLSEPLIGVMGCDVPRLFVPVHHLPGPLPSRERGFKHRRRTAIWFLGWDR